MSFCFCGLESPPSSRNATIQQLRGVAILLILCHHWNWLHPILPRGFIMAWSGVDLFFAISGFVVTMSFLRTLPDLEEGSTFLERLTQGRNQLKAFYVRRIFRIIPPTLFWLGVGIILSLVANSSGVFGSARELFVELVGFLSLTYNYLTYNGGPFRFDILWSLAVEEHFYLLLPAFFLVFRSESQRLCAVFIGIFLVAVLIRPLYAFFYARPTGDWLAVRFVSHARFDSILVGVALALLTRSGWGTSLRGLSRWMTRVMAAFALMLLLSVPAYLPTSVSHNIGFIALAFASVSLVTLAVHCPHPLVPTRPLRALLFVIGERSFSLYLLHRLVFTSYFALQQAFPSLPLLAADFGIPVEFVQGIFCVVVAILAAEVSYRAVEMPCMRWGTKISQRILTMDK